MNIDEYLENLGLSNTANEIDEHHELSVYTEDGITSVTCKDCGKSWSVNFANINNIDCIDFEGLYCGEDLLCEEEK